MLIEIGSASQPLLNLHNATEHEVVIRWNLPGHTHQLA